MEIRRYLPSKRFASFVISIAIAGAVIGAASILGSGKPLTVAFNAISAIGTDKAVGDIDSDGDGLKDWEEGVRGTDSQKSDTDGDGTSDGEEARLYRDPTKPGPDDSTIDEKGRKFLDELLAAASSTNLTDHISQTIFARYVEARSEGRSGDIQTQADMVGEAMNSAEVSYRGSLYENSDLTVVADSPNNIRAFANGAMNAVLERPDASFTLAMHTFAAAMEGDMSALARLRAIGDEYRRVAQAMASVPVPRSYAEQYLLAINAFDMAGGSFEDLAAVQSDPIRSVAGLKNYDQMLTGGTTALLLLAQQIARAGVVFSASEPGRGWNDLIAASTFSS